MLLHSLQKREIKINKRNLRYDKPSKARLPVIANRKKENSNRTPTNIRYTQQCWSDDVAREDAQDVAGVIWDICRARTEYAVLFENLCGAFTATDHDRGLEWRT